MLDKKVDKARVKDKRRFPRFDCSYPVKYSTMGTACIESDTQAKDISMEGIRMNVSRLIKPGDTLKLDIFNNGIEAPIPAIGEVRWTAAHQADQKFVVDAGIEFIEIAPADARRLLAV